MFCFIICRTSTRVHNKHESIKLFKLVHFQLTPSLVKIFANSCSILNMWVAKSCLGLCHHWVTGGYLSVVGCAIVCSLVTSGGPPSSAAGGASNRKGRGKAITSQWVTQDQRSHLFVSSTVTIPSLILITLGWWYTMASFILFLKENYGESIFDKSFIDKNLLVKFFVWVWNYYI